MIRTGLALMVLAVAGCQGGTGVVSAPPVPKTPAQAVFEVKAAEAAALAVFLRYKALPSCALQVHPTLCSEPGVVTMVQRADLVAAKAVDTAETAVRTPGFGQNVVQTMLISAQAAVGVLVAATANLKVN